MKKYRFLSIAHMGEMYDDETGDEAGLPSGTTFYLASDVDKYRNDSIDINEAAGREMKRMAARITELEAELATQRRT